MGPGGGVNVASPGLVVAGVPSPAGRRSTSYRQPRWDEGSGAGGAGGTVGSTPVLATRTITASRSAAISGGATGSASLISHEHHVGHIDGLVQGKIHVLSSSMISQNGAFLTFRRRCDLGNRPTSTRRVTSSVSVSPRSGVHATRPTRVGHACQREDRAAPLRTGRIHAVECGSRSHALASPPTHDCPRSSRTETSRVSRPRPVRSKERRTRLEPTNSGGSHTRSGHGNQLTAKQTT